MSEWDFRVDSHDGPYEVRFRQDALSTPRDKRPAIIVIDERVKDLYGDKLRGDWTLARLVTVEAAEDTKSLEAMPALVERLVAQDVRKSDELIAVGGGITQDVVAFAATTMFRGMDWSFVPTTLLAQADSCIGSKSSINAAGTKNLLGTFKAPISVTIDTAFLGTLAESDLRSGIGEMLKVHAISGPADFDSLTSEYDQLLEDPDSLMRAIHRSLLMKRGLIELDEYDRGPRNVMNYGHSFGHAIEIATDYGIPHGIAVTIGMDMANFVAMSIGETTEQQYLRMHAILVRNAGSFAQVEFPRDRLFGALQRDKKNTATHLRLILPDKLGTIGIVSVEPTEHLRSAIDGYSLV